MELSQALAHYVSGYVTKAEKSNKQDIWQKVRDNKSIYSKHLRQEVRDNTSIYSKHLRQEEHLRQEVRDNKSIYRLWSFGLRCLQTPECGLYEASDILLSDHLCEKSVQVKWIDVSLPNKRSHRLKKQLFARTG